MEKWKKVQRSICYNIHAFNFEKLLSTSQYVILFSDIALELLKILATLVLVSYRPVSYEKNV